METQDSEKITVGSVVAGKYRVERVLGSGGMGMVVAAQHLQLGEHVAIKMLLPEMLKHREAVQRFTREARAAVKIKSEHVARVTDVGTLPSGVPYMVMEYLDGEDLGQRIGRLGAAQPEQAVEFILHACEALAEAHSLGIVHRDIKPANLFCVRRPDGLLSVKVLDFGISKLHGPGADDLSMTKTSTVMGSPHYMSPEQMMSARNADFQSDIWSLGAVLFELLTGQVPFEAETFPELIVKISGADAPDVSKLNAGVPAGLRDVVKKCLQRQREDRYRNVAELAVALVPFGPERRAAASAERVLRVMDVAAQARGEVGPGPVFSATEMSQATQRPPSALNVEPRGTVGEFANSAVQKSGRGRLIGLVALVLLLGGIGAALLISSERGSVSDQAVVAEQAEPLEAEAEGGGEPPPDELAPEGRSPEAEPGFVGAHPTRAQPPSPPGEGSATAVQGNLAGPTEPTPATSRSSAPADTSAGASTSPPPKPVVQRAPARPPAPSSPSGSSDATNASPKPAQGQTTKPKGTSRESFGGRL